jgi:hypothetical protein
MRKAIYFISLFFILIGIINAKNSGLTDAQKDGYTLFSYSLNDAVNSDNKTIKTKTVDKKTVYTFNDHVLSCGTHMKGEIIKTDNKNDISYTGKFTVTKNSYNITSLIVDFTESKNNPVKRSGKMKINNTDCDINLFFD